MSADIESVQDKSGTGTILRVKLTDGTGWWMPQPCNTWHQKKLDEFLDGGGTIDPLPAEAQHDPPR